MIMYPKGPSEFLIGIRLILVETIFYFSESDVNSVKQIPPNLPVIPWSFHIMLYWN